MNPNQQPLPSHPDAPQAPDYQNWPPQEAQPPINQLYEQQATSAPMVAERSPEIIPQETIAANNPFMPPVPGAFTPNPQPVVEPIMQPGYIPQNADISQQPYDPTLPVNQTVETKRRQAKRLLAVAIVAGLVVLIGIVTAVVLLAGRNKDGSSANQQVSVNDQLKEDLNTFGLGVINFRNGDKVFTITPQDVALFRTSFIPPEFNDPRTNQPYVVTSEIPETGEIQYVASAICKADDSIQLSGNNEDFAARILLDSGTLLCIQKNEVTGQKVTNQE